MKFIGAELKDRVEITVENNWNLQFQANLADAIENAADGSAGRERSLRRELIDDSIGERIGEWQSELNQIGASFFQCKREIDRSFQIRIARANVPDKFLTLLGAEAREALIDPVVHATS